jgi:outer membrane biosynthesis protein TonB
MELPPAQTRLTAELWWGDTRQQAQSFQRAVTGRDFTLWGFDVPDDFVLAQPAAHGAFLVHPPSGAHPALTLEPGATHTFTAGPMRLTLRVDAVLPELPRAKFEGWPVTALAAVMLAGLVLAVALTPEPEEQPFTPKIFRQFISLMPPPPKVKPEPASPKSASADPKTSPPARSRPPRGSTPPRTAAADPFASLKQITGDRSFKAILDATKKSTAGRSKNLFAGLGTPGGKKGFDLGIVGDSHIGAVGAKTGGVLTGKIYGTGRIGGLLDRPSATRIGFHGGPATSIDKDALARAIAEHLHEVSSCYERALISNGNGGGRLSLEWTVTTAGTVAAAKVKSSTLKDGSIASCVLTALKGWRFPQAKGGSVLVSYPFVFQSSDF